jgi:superfamily II DNA or RNA helicase
LRTFELSEQKIHVAAAIHVPAAAVTDALRERLSFPNPRLKKARQRLASAVRVLTGRDERSVRALSNTLFSLAREHGSDDFGAMAKVVKHVLYGDANKSTNDDEWDRLKRVVGATLQAGQHRDNLPLYYEDGSTTDGQDLVVPRGALRVIMSEVPNAEYVDVRVDGDCAEPALEWAGPRPRAYQAEAAEALLQHDGIVLLPCGAGKTLTALHAIAVVNRRAVVLVPTKEIKAEWFEECEACLGFTPGLVGEGKFDIDRRLTVAIYATVVRLGVDRFSDLFDTAGVVVVDECHHCADNKVGDAVRATRARHRWGLTGTLHREDGMHVLTEAIFGPVVAQATHVELMAAGHLAAPEIERVDSPWECPDGIDPSENWHAMVRALTEDDSRNDLVIDLLWRVSSEHHRVLALTCLQDHADELARRLDELGIQAAAVHSGMAAKERKSTMARFKADDLQVVTAVNVADEGLDVPELDSVAIVGPVKARAKSIQRLGRLMRPHDGKAAKLYDVVDASVPHLLNQWRARRRAYKSVLGGQHV